MTTFMYTFTYMNLENAKRRKPEIGALESAAQCFTSLLEKIFLVQGTKQDKFYVSLVPKMFSRVSSVLWDRRTSSCDCNFPSLVEINGKVSPSSASFFFFDDSFPKTLSPRIVPFFTRE